MINKLLRTFCFLFIVKPIVFIILGINVHHRTRLPTKGPAILVANHNSHLDTLILMGLFNRKMIPFLRPVAAADYFLSSKFMKWFSQKIIGIIPIARTRTDDCSDPLEPISKALNENAIVIFYPEGTRGEPELLAKFRYGIASLAKLHPKVEIHPLFIYGAGKALPKGEALLVPFTVDVYVGESITWNGDHQKFMDSLENEISLLKNEARITEWE